MAYNGRMTNDAYIAYGHNRSDRELRKLGFEFEKGKVFIDNKQTDRAELNAMLAACRPGVCVVMVQLSDLGHGAKASQMRKAIEATGATVYVPEKELQKRGPKLKGEIPADKIEWAQALYNNKALTRQQVADRIEVETGVRLTRGQLATRFGKP
jgi:hypothetical protein